MKKHFSEEHIIGFLGEAEAGLLIKELCRGHSFQKPVTIFGAASLAV
ncbi:putative transposase [Vreelandella arcis]|uniref:Putative transposase n=1 Tax=Vreelandella arcis TaxID=416873 RepID=A0A1H0BJM5_9GAMM|nr:putative transposase [Halomonas arcis]